MKERESRRHIRFSGRWIIHYSPIVRDQFEETYTRDLSLGGVAFDTAEQLPLAMSLKLKVGAGFKPAPTIEAVGVVTRSRRKEAESGFLTAVRLISLPDEDWERLVDWALRHQGLSRRRKNASDTGRVVEGENLSAEIGAF